MPKISITLPSIYPEACARALQNIREATLCDYEVVVVSPFDPGSDPRISWIKDGPEKRGAAFAQDRAARAAKGEFIAAFSDDFLFSQDWDQRLLEDFERREAAPENAGKIYAMGMRYDHLGLVGTQFGVYYPNFPFMRRSTVEKIGWVSPDYVRGLGDGDLGMRIWSSGGRCEWSESIILLITPDDLRKGANVVTPQDVKLFAERWGKTIGKSWKKSILADFCYDVVPEDFPDLCDPSHRTIYSKNRSNFFSIYKVPQQPKLIETIGVYNIVAIGSKYFGVPQSIGPIDLEKENLSEIVGLLKSSTYESIVDRVKRVQQPQKPTSIASRILDYLRA